MAPRHQGLADDGFKPSQGVMVLRDQPVDMGACLGALVAADPPLDLMAAVAINSHCRRYADLDLLVAGVIRDGKALGEALNDMGSPLDAGSATG